MIRVCALAALLALAGCASPAHVVQTQYVSLDVPPALLECPAAPVPPLAKRQSQVAAYIGALWRSREICADHLSAVRRIVRPHHGG